MAWKKTNWDTSRKISEPTEYPNVNKGIDKIDLLKFYTMERAKHDFFRNGAEVQKTADITVDLKRVEKKKIEKWTPAQRRLAAEWLNEVERSFKIFKSEILSA